MKVSKSKKMLTFVLMLLIAVSFVSCNNNAGNHSHDTLTSAPPQPDATEQIDGHEHDFISWSTSTPATCAKSGEKFRVCKTCSYVETQTIPATGSHTLGKWTKTKSATCEGNGEQYRVCQNCSYTETQSISAKGHTTDSGLCQRCYKYCGPSVNEDDVFILPLDNFTVTDGTATMQSDGTLRIDSYMDFITITVDNNISKNLEDFPILAVLTRNFCVAHRSGECTATEDVQFYTMVGTTTEPPPPSTGFIYPGWKYFSHSDLCFYGPISIYNGEKAGDYLIFIGEKSDENESQGRINGISIKFGGDKNFDIVLVGFFKSESDADIYISSYLGN